MQTNDLGEKPLSWIRIAPVIVYGSTENDIAFFKEADLIDFMQINAMKSCVLTEDELILRGMQQARKGFYMDHLTALQETL